MSQDAFSVVNKRRVVVVGAGIGGLAAALRLQHAGCAVTVLDRADGPGGKMRTIPSVAGPIDCGPTVLTLRGVFDALFADVGARLEDHIKLIAQPILARHFWPDGGQLDLLDDPVASRTAVAGLAGAPAAAEFQAFCDDAKVLFDAFDAPMMQSADPSQLDLAYRVLRQPSLIGKMAPWSTLAARLARRFSDPRLAQLFGRYATYVGGSPYHAPNLLSVIWQAEAAGVWCVQGGMHRLALALTDLAGARGVDFRFGTDAERIETLGGKVSGVRARGGDLIGADVVVFNGDPRALASGYLGDAVSGVAAQTRSAPRSLSARVWSFAATVSGPELAHHNVFFARDPRTEFDDLHHGHMPKDPTIYVCAQDRGQGHPTPRPERFEIILNAAPLTIGTPPEKEYDRCRTLTFQTLARFGLRFDPLPDLSALTTPTGFEALFPASAGSLYGQSPHGLTAALKRPRARTSVPGLYLAGGGAHPGAGVPMAALSGRHAAETIMRDLSLTSMSRPTVMPGGISTASATTAPARFRSSGS
jgi:1-hydroxycarotenoid 3,4-desaturase